MAYRIWAFSILTLFPLVQSAVAAPIEAYGRLPTLQDVSISPDGSNLAFVQSSNLKRMLIISQLATRQVVSRIDLGSDKFAGQIWADNSHLLIITHTTARGGATMGGPKHEYLLVQSYDLKHHTLLDPMAHPRNVDRTMNIASGTPMPRNVNGHTVVFIPGIYFPLQQGLVKSRKALFAADLNTGITKMIEEGSPSSQNWLINSQGIVVGETSYDEVKRHFGLMVKPNGYWTEIYGVATAIDVPSVAGFVDNGAVAILEKGDHPGLKTISLEDGKEGPPLAQAQDLSAVISQSLTGKIVGGVRATMKADTVFFGAADQALWSWVTASNPQANVSLLSWSCDHSKLVIHVSGPLDGDVYKLVDVSARRITTIGPGYDGIGPQDYAPVSTISYAAQDGLPI